MRKKTLVEGDSEVHHSVQMICIHLYVVYFAANFIQDRLTSDQHYFWDKFCLFWHRGFFAHSALFSGIVSFAWGLSGRPGLNEKIILMSWIHNEINAWLVVPKYKKNNLKREKKSFVWRLEVRVLVLELCHCLHHETLMRVQLMTLTFSAEPINMLNYQVLTPLKDDLNSEFVICAALWWWVAHSL